jgi:hypothetical protein
MRWTARAMRSPSPLRMSRSASALQVAGAIGAILVAYGLGRHVARGPRACARVRASAGAASRAIGRPRGRAVELDAASRFDFEESTHIQICRLTRARTLDRQI